jgi:glucokinase
VLIAGVDIGGTNVQVGVVADDHEVVERAKRPTPTEGPDALVETIVDMITAFDADADVIGVGIGIPGPVHDGQVMRVPNLEGWREPVDIAELVSDRLNVPVALGNDANVGLLGEWVNGVAQGRSNVLGVWMGTGIGSGLILGGRPFVGSLGGAGEFGHMIIRADGALCSCGRRGCVEAYAGRRRMADTIKQMVKAGRTTSLFQIQDDEGKDRPTSKVWKRALKEGDPLVTEMFDGAVEAVALGVASTINLLDLEQVVIGGGLAEKLGQDLADRIREQAEPFMMQPNPELSFDVAALGDDSGVVGAASIGRPKVHR